MSKQHSAEILSCLSEVPEALLALAGGARAGGREHKGEAEMPVTVWG